ncbi:putative uncharacterized protein DDB_G0291812, partial [Aphidius gifuensis]|uniref:putative uncharacterized protein DDB_G0291812 n=1 Tax=Aphidius gifuensis TaxID=684658 RepID=UPI001CDD511F
FGNTKTINKTNIKIISIGTLLNIVNGAPADYDAAIRAERSANLSHITGPSKKIQIFIKNRFLQIFPDGTVNGSSDPSNYTIIQRTSVSIGQLKIQGVATCLYLCMDACGLVYGSREYTDECVFNEMLEQSRYNTYSSVRWSTPRKTYYLGLNRNGQPRKVQYRGNNWDKLAEYARVLPITVPKERIVAIEKISTCPKHNIRHHHNKSHGHHQNHNQSSPIILPNDKDDKDKFKCKKNDKRKKRKRRCKIDDKPKFDCNISIKNHENKIKTDDKIELQSKRSCQDAASDEFCRQQILDASTKKRKSRKDTDNNNKKKNNNNNNNNHKNKKIDNISPLSSSFNNDNNNKSLIEKKNIKIDEQYSALLEDSTIDSITVKTETTDSTLSSSSSSSKLLNPSLDISLTIDSSVEVSDEDSNSHEEDTIITNDYGIPMTTMDTTPPERTEDYTKATTQSILQFLNINKQLNDDTIIKKLNDPIGQFAM